MNKLFLSSALVVLFFLGCSTPQTRIEENPTLYQSLSEPHRSAVREGRVIEGMSADAVSLALGEPDRVYHGKFKGKILEQWVYTRTQRIVHPSWHSAWSPYWRSPYYELYEPFYIERPFFTVTFENKKVVGWEQMR
jgi:outer membrane protein assembly factor BamE (lipoprotein component of BamABCDE complex)